MMTSPQAGRPDAASLAPGLSACQAMRGPESDSKGLDAGPYPCIGAARERQNAVTGVVTPGRVDNREFAGFVRRIIRAYAARAATADPAVLAELASLRDEVDQATELAVVSLSLAGFSWAEIGCEIGMHREHAYRKWHWAVDAERARRQEVSAALDALQARLSGETE